MNKETMPEFLKELRRKDRMYELMAEKADREGRTKDYFWYAGAHFATAEIISQMKEDEGV
jgi:hypothetical protein